MSHQGFCNNFPDERCRGTAALCWTSVSPWRSRSDLVAVWAGVLCGEKGDQQTIWKVLNWQDGGEKVSGKRAAHQTRKLKKKKTEASSHSVKSLTEMSDVST